MNVCKIVTLFCKDVEAAYVSQQRCIWNTEFQTNYSRHDIFLYYTHRIWFFTPVFRLGIFGQLLGTTNPIVVVLTLVIMKDLSECHCF